MHKNLATLFFLLISRLSFCQWQQPEFVIGTFWDPALSTNTDTSSAEVTAHISNFAQAKNAYFNLLTGGQNGDYIVHTTAGMDYALYIASKTGLKYLVTDYYFYGNPPFNLSNANAASLHYKGLDQARRNAMYGYNLKDEPALADTTDLKKWISYFKTNDNAKLAYVNLFPRYYYPAGSQGDLDYEAYLDHFINDANPLNNPDVISYDNYPIVKGTPPTVNKDYFYNLDVIRKKSAGRPFWSYPLSTSFGNMADPTASQLRFSTFCPVAYGAKGLVYFTYDYPKTAGWLIDYANDGLGGWNTAIYDQLYDSVITVTIPADFDGDGKADVNVKGNDGSWWIDYANNGFTGWDLKLSTYGNATAHPVPTDYDGDGKADLSVKTDAGSWLINYAANGFLGWDVTINNVGDATQHPVPADYDGDGKADLSTKGDDGSWLIDYAANGFNGWDVTLSAYGNSTAHPAPADYDGDGKADLSVKTDAGSWLINYAANGFLGWDVTINNVGDATNHSAPADYDGDGKTDLSTKSDDGHWKIDYEANGFTGWDVSLPGYGSSYMDPIPADYNGDGKDDICIKTNDIGFRSGIIDANGNPTPNYYTVQEINHYITKIAGPVVMNSKCLGAFHKSIAPTNEPLPASQMLTANTPFIADLNDNDLLVGIFQDKMDTTTYYGIVVNKSFNAVASVNIILKGNFQNSVFLAPSVIGYTGSTALSAIAASYNSSLNQTTFSIPGGLAGGEGRVFTIKNVLLNTEGELSNIIKIFPNPGNGNVTVSQLENFNNATMRLMNMTGQIIMEKTKISGDHFTFDISGKVNGIYFLEVDQNGSVSRVKLCKN